MLHGLRWQPGDELLISNQEHPALSHPAAYLQNRGGPTVRVFAIDTDPQITMQNIRAALGSQDSAHCLQPGELRKRHSAAGQGTLSACPRTWCLGAGGRRAIAGRNTRGRDGNELRFLRQQRAQMAVRPKGNGHPIRTPRQTRLPCHKGRLARAPSRILTGAVRTFTFASSRTPAASNSARAIKPRLPVSMPLSLGLKSLVFPTFSHTLGT